MALSTHSALPQQQRPKLRLDSLTGLRWWAAFGVFAYHFLNIGEFTGSHLAVMGYSGVAFFFVLSGFVLTWSARPTTTVRQFWMRRFARIWPAHFVALLLAIPVFYPLHPNPDHFWEKAFAWGPLLVSAVLLHGFSHNALYLFGGNPASWTLSCEAFFYALHPAIHRVFQKLRTYALPLLIAVCVALGYFTRFYWEAPVPLARAWEFFLGIIAALLLKRGVRFRVPMVVMYIGLAALGLFYWALKRAGYFPDVATLLTPYWSLIQPLVFMAAIMIAATADIEGRRSLMRHPIMVRGGEWSYCFYLVHATILYAFRAAYVESVGIVGFALLLLASLAGAAALYYLVERPCERRLRAWGDRRFGCPPSGKPTPTRAASPTDPNPQAPQN